MDVRSLNVYFRSLDVNFRNLNVGFGSVNVNFRNLNVGSECPWSAESEGGGRGAKPPERVYIFPKNLDPGGSQPTQGLYLHLLSAAQANHLVTK